MADRLDSDDSDKDLYQPEGADSNDMEKSSGDDEGESEEEPARSQTGTAGPGNCGCQTVHSSPQQVQNLRLPLLRSVSVVQGLCHTNRV